MYCLVLLATPSAALRPPPLLVLPHSEQNEAIVGSDSDAAGPLDVLEHGVAQHRHSNGEHALEHDLIEVSLRQGPHDGMFIDIGRAGIGILAREHDPGRMGRRDGESSSLVKSS
jgi:hypothetical protein